MLALAIEWRRDTGRVGWLWVLAAGAPLAVGLSFPAVLVAAGIGFALLPAVARSGRWDVRLAYVAFGLGAVATFLALQGFYKTSPQDEAYFYRDWAEAFPPFDGPIALAVWFLKIHTGFAFAYPIGGASGLSSLTFVFFAAGVVALWRSRPAGGPRARADAVRDGPGRRGDPPLSVRDEHADDAVPRAHDLPFAGLGASAILARFGRAGSAATRSGGSSIALAALGLWHSGYDLTHPYKTASDERARAFAKWFWTEKSINAELACAKVDLGEVFGPSTGTTTPPTPTSATSGSTRPVTPAASRCASTPSPSRTRSASSSTTSSPRIPPASATGWPPCRPATGPGGSSRSRCPRSSPGRARRRTCITSSTNSPRPDLPVAAGADGAVRR